VESEQEQSQNLPFYFVHELANLPPCFWTCGWRQIHGRTLAIRSFHGTSLLLPCL